MIIIIIIVIIIIIIIIICSNLFIICLFIHLFILNKTSWSQNLKVTTNLQHKKNRKECLKYRRSQVSCFHRFDNAKSSLWSRSGHRHGYEKKNEHCGDFVSCKVFSCFPKCMSVSFERRRKWSAKNLPRLIYTKYGNVVQWEKTIVNRLQRATTRGEFLRAAWEFEVVLNLGQ